MIEQVDALLMSWAETVLGEGVVVYQAPANSTDDTLVNLYLLDLVDCPPARGGVGAPPLQFSVRYLVTTSLGEPEEAHRMLSQLVFAAMECPDFEVEFQSLDSSSWMAFGATPRPGFLLKVPVRKERLEPPTKLVLQPPIVDVSSITSLQGLVLGPGSVPWVGARVELPSLQKATRTNTRGQFRFATVPREPQDKSLRITAKGRVFDVPVTQPEDPGESVEVQLDPLEGR